MKPKITWIMVADGVRARLFMTKGWNHGLERVTDRDFVGDRREAREIESDRPGRVNESVGGMRHAYEPTEDVRRFEKHRFAREMAGMLNKARTRGRFDRLVLVAPPRTLGDLRKELDEHTARMVYAELDKDLTDLPPERLTEHLEKAMPV